MAMVMCSCRGNMGIGGGLESQVPPLLVELVVQPVETGMCFPGGTRGLPERAKGYRERMERKICDGRGIVGVV